MTQIIRIGNRVQHSRGGTGTATGYVNYDNGKRDTQAIEVTWDATGMTTAEWKADLCKLAAARAEVRSA